MDGRCCVRGYALCGAVRVTCTDNEGEVEIWWGWMKSCGQSDDNKMVVRSCEVAVQLGFRFRHRRHNQSLNPKPPSFVSVHYSNS
jgi:hypothetical protein